MVKNLLEQRFFRLLSEYSQCKVSANELTEAINELAFFTFSDVTKLSRSMIS